MTKKAPVVIVEKTYKLLVWAVPKLGKFPRDQRFLLADKIQTILSKILEQLIIAAYSKRKIDILRGVNLELEKLRYFSRLAKDLKYLNIDAHHYFANCINEIGRMAGAWIKNTAGPGEGQG